MTFSAKTAYGLVALIDIACSEPGGGPLRGAEIARRQEIPERYLEQMLATLRRAGFLRSVRGPRGGYLLARPPAEISVAEVVACLEGDPGSDRRGDPGTPEFTLLASLEADLERQRRDLLASRSLEDLVRERERLDTAPVMFFI